MYASHLSAKLFDRQHRRSHRNACRHNNIAMQNREHHEPLMRVQDGYPFVSEVVFHHAVWAKTHVFEMVCDHLFVLEY